MSNQIEIQNALRVLTQYLEDGDAIIFLGGDLVQLSKFDGKTVNITPIGRTQDVAEEIIKLK